MSKCIKANFELLFRRKNFWVVLLLMLAIAIGTFSHDVFEYVGENIDNTPDANSLFYMQGMGKNADYILFIFPILATVSYADIHAKDCVNQTNLLCLVRAKRREWYYSQAIVVFLGAFIVFLIPTLLNLILNNITFSNSGLYEWGSEEYSVNYFADIEGTNIRRDVLQRGWLLKGVMYQSALLYNALYALLFSLTAGILAYFAYGVSMLLGKGKIYVYFIPFVLVRLIGAFEVYAIHEAKVYVSCDLTNYLTAGEGGLGCYYPAFYGVMLLLMVIATVLIENRVRKIELQIGL